jgi:hypothetical protein
LAENNKKPFESQFTSAVERQPSRQGRPQGKREVNRDVEIATILLVAAGTGTGEQRPSAN